MPAAKEYCVTIKYKQCVGRSITKSVILKVDRETVEENTLSVLDTAIAELNKSRWGTYLITRSKVLNYEIFPMADIKDRFVT